MGKIILDEVNVIMVFLRTNTLSNLSLYLCDPVNMGGYLAMKENIVVCTSFGYLADSFYILSGWLAPLVIEVRSCCSGERFITQVEIGGAVEVVGTMKGKEVESKNETSQLQKEKWEDSERCEGEICANIVQMM
ncbi:hypothetical protein Godav_006557 [Gossypium davidsonii]|uniref:Uncharacterized protein n=1 Tax=Gossypium davidsonii TaxID=34287 RepID=A0A7J8S520_GOSDV|nr:hypothetical protein [Gossypium davidsonii]